MRHPLEIAHAIAIINPKTRGLLFSTLSQPGLQLCFNLIGSFLRSQGGWLKLIGCYSGLREVSKWTWPGWYSLLRCSPSWRRCSPCLRTDSSAASSGPPRRPPPCQSGSLQEQPTPHTHSGTLCQRPGAVRSCAGSGITTVGGGGVVLPSTGATPI